MNSQQIAAGERWLIEGGGTELELGAAVVLWFWETPGPSHVRDLSAAGKSCSVSVIGPFIGLPPEGIRRGYAVLVVTDRAVPRPTVCLSVGWSDGDTELVELPFRQVDRRVASGLDVPAPTVAICMATFEPRMDLFTNQVRSLQAQSTSDWICLVQDDGSSAQTLEHMQEVFGDDPRFVLEENAENVGFYLNFGRSLARVPAGTRYVALCDQDDTWYPDKLECLVGALDADPTATLIYSDMRVVDETGTAIRDDFPLGVASDRGIEAMVVANLVTGCSTLFRASLLDVALPLPEARNAYHDHWIATVAAARGCAPTIRVR
ncbi:glycosyltransferase [Nostocoides sp. HKS02]|uniref:glycosyltransferase n=1 Tax=Nostocoides sp. HKS02 TaxID=1813880 RepID=UPI0012B4B932|nr:glycosyltransferase [Tetrasphaera sp. HKS02]QGN57958.1 glycosyltransferase [Tetrasphaera sp. HKS02]